jgi:hypothetical protein
VTLTGRAAAVAALALAAPLLAACGESTEPPEPGADGRVDATPRALAAVVIDHVDPGEPRRTTGHWSDPADPLAIEAQVDYGEDPEGGGPGPTRTVRVDVSSTEAFEERDRSWFRCRPRLESGGCEEQEIDGTTVLYRWFPGTPEEEGGSYSWLVVRDDEVVTVAYDRSGLFRSDPRRLDLLVEPEDLRAAAVDTAMSLRTTPEAYAAGADLDSYEGVEKRPELPPVTPTTPKELAARVVDYIGVRPASVRPSRLDDFGPDAVGVHMVFPARRGEAAYTLDVLTTVGRVGQIDPLPCPVQRVRTSYDGCFAWDPDTASTWTLAGDGEPGRQWIIGAQDDDVFNRVESVGVLITSAAIDHNPFDEFTDPGGPPLPEMLMADLSGFTGDLSVGPERRRRPGRQ